jgi:hypothetical protein
MLIVLLFLGVLMPSSWGQSSSLLSLTNPLIRDDDGLSVFASRSGNVINLFWCRKDALISHSVTCSADEIKERASLPVEDFHKAIGTNQLLGEIKELQKKSENLKLLVSLCQGSDGKKIIPEYFDGNMLDCRYHYRTLRKEELSKVEAELDKKVRHLQSAVEISEAINEDKFLLKLYQSKELRDFAKDITLFNNPGAYFKALLINHHKVNGEKPLILGQCIIQPEMKKTTVYKSTPNGQGFSIEGEGRSGLNVTYETSYNLVFNIKMKDKSKDMVIAYERSGSINEQLIQTQCYNTSLEDLAPETAISDTSRQSNKLLDPSDKKDNLKRVPKPSASDQ